MDQVGLILHVKAQKVFIPSSVNDSWLKSLMAWVYGVAIMGLRWSFFDYAETEAWFIDSFEEWRKAKNLSNFILLGHSFGGYVAAKYALKVIFLSFL